MKITVLSASPTKDKNIIELEAEYLKRLKPLIKIEVMEGKVKPKKPTNNLLVLLCESGVELSSTQFARFVEKQMVQGSRNITFAIGDAYGWSDEDRKTADKVISLSKLTFPYQLARLVLIEQLYRGFSIINNSPYHK